MKDKPQRGFPKEGVSKEKRGQRGSRTRERKKNKYNVDEGGEKWEGLGRFRR